MEQSIQRIGKYADLQELTPYALQELAKSIYVEAPGKNSGKHGVRAYISAMI